MVLLLLLLSPFIELNIIFSKIEYYIEYPRYAIVILVNGLFHINQITIIHILQGLSL